LSGFVGGGGGACRVVGASFDTTCVLRSGMDVDAIEVGKEAER